MDSLKEIVFDQSTRELIRTNPEVRLLASLSDVLDVVADYEKAVESALSEKAESFIFESHSDIEKAISSLKGKSVDKPRYHIVPLPCHP